jgi:hypothetical protein
MALPVNNLSVQYVLSTLGVTSKKTRDIFYNSNGTLKSESELRSIVTGNLHPSHCPDLATLRTRRNLSSFKGYENFTLSVGNTTYSQDWRGILSATAQGRPKIHVSSGGASFSVSSNESTLKFLQYADGIIPYWDTNYNVTLENRTGVLTVTAGGQSVDITVTQRRKPYISGLPLNPHISNSVGDNSPSWEVYQINSNYGHEWDVISDHQDFFGSINDERMLRLSYVPELDVGYNNKSGSATMTISLEGVSYSLDVSGTYHSENLEPPSEQ